MTIFCDMLKLGSTAALDCQTGQNKGRYCKKELLFLLVLLAVLLHFQYKKNTALSKHLQLSKV